MVEICELQIRQMQIEEFTNGSSFGPGLTLAAILSESSLVVHTAPQRQMLNLDLFSCRPFPMRRIQDLIAEKFGPLDIKQLMILQRAE